MKKNVIVSLADSNYFELLNELVDSIKSFEQSKDIAICILDAGLSEEQKNILAKKVDEMKLPPLVLPSAPPAPLHPPVLRREISRFSR